MTNAYQDADTPFEAYPQDRHDALLRHQAALRRLIAVSGLLDTEPATLDAVTAVLEEQARVLEALPHGRPFQRFRVGIPQDDPNSSIPFSPISGRYNPMAPPLELSIEGKVLVGTARFHDAYEGPNGCVHGGIVAAVYDQILAYANLLSGVGGPTASLETRYRRPTPLYEELRFEAWTESVEGRKIRTFGRCLLGGEVLTECSGLFIVLDPERSYPQWSNRTRSEQESF